MRKLLFLFPELTMQQGGHSAQMAFLNNSKRFFSATAVTYKKIAAGTLFLDDVLTGAIENPQHCIFVIHWGPDVPALLKRLKGLAVVYIAHSTGWGFKLPLDVPVLAVSRNTQAYWGRQAPDNPIYFLPNIITDTFYNSSEPRDIDVLVMKRKSSRYLLKELIPRLKPHCRVNIIDDWTDDIAAQMRNSKLFLYDSSEYWLKQGVSEGFGLPPLEAMACGCQIFSSLNDALSDYLDPGVNCQQLRVHSASFDAENILGAVAKWQPINPTYDPAADWRSDKVAARLNTVLPLVNAFFDTVHYHHQQTESTKPVSAVNQLLIQFVMTRCISLWNR